MSSERQVLELDALDGFGGREHDVGEQDPHGNGDHSLQHLWGRKATRGERVC